MSESQTLEFGAIISISLPEGEGRTDFHVLLASSDLIVGENGRMKSLGDCTLAELQQFADDFEAGVWSAYESMTLFDLVVEGQATISVVSADTKAKETAPKELTLEHQIIFPEPKARATIGFESDEEDAEEFAEELAEALEDVDQSTEQVSEDSPAAVSAKVDELESALEDLSEILDAKAGQEPAIEEEEPRGAEAVYEPEVPKQNGAVLTEVSVAKTEPVFEEREAEEESKVELPEVEEKRKLFRILGKRRPIGHPTWTAVDILISERAFRAAQVHADSSLQREVAGILIGPHPEKQPDGRYVVHISDAIIAKHTRMQGASVTYTPESWRYVNDRLAEMYPNEEAVIVGWYHTHPGFGIFLSGMDQFIHQNFFTQTWHIAMVLDPLAQESGFFCWDRGLSKVDKYQFPWPVWAPGSW